MGQNATIRHNTIACDAPDVPPDAGCSAGLTGYGDFGPVQNNLIDNNYFVATTGGFCAYGGSSHGKPYSNQTSGIVFRNNVFEKEAAANAASGAPSPRSTQHCPATSGPATSGTPAAPSHQPTNPRASWRAGRQVRSSRLGVIEGSHLPGRDTRIQCVRVELTAHHRPGGDNRAAANSSAGQKHGTRANPAAIADHDSITNRLASTARGRPELMRRRSKHGLHPDRGSSGRSGSDRGCRTHTPG